MVLVLGAIAELMIAIFFVASQAAQEEHSSSRQLTQAYYGNLRDESDPIATVDNLLKDYGIGNKPETAYIKAQTILRNCLVGSTEERCTKAEATLPVLTKEMFKDSHYATWASPAKLYTIEVRAFGHPIEPVALHYYQHDMALSASWKVAGKWLSLLAGFSFLIAIGVGGVGIKIRSRHNKVDMRNTTDHLSVSENKPSIDLTKRDIIYDQY